jgi:hypothetical protein
MPISFSSTEKSCRTTPEKEAWLFRLYLSNKHVVVFAVRSSVGYSIEDFEASSKEAREAGDTDSETHRFHREKRDR